MCLCSHYGAQAVVVSIDPKRVYVSELPTIDDDTDVLLRKTIVPLREGEVGPQGERFCWWQVTVKGGREARDLDALQLARVRTPLLPSIPIWADLIAYFFLFECFSLICTLAVSRYVRYWARARSCSIASTWMDRRRAMISHS